MRIEVIVIYAALSIIVFAIMNFIGRKFNEISSFGVKYANSNIDDIDNEPLTTNILMAIFIPNLVIVIAGGCFHSLQMPDFYKNIYIVTILYFLLKNFVVLFILRRKELWNFVYEFSIASISVLVSILIYFKLLDENFSIFINLEDFKNEIWLLIVLFLSHFVKKFLDEKIKQKDVCTTEMKNNYIINRYLKFKNKYSDLLTIEKKYHNFVYSIMIYEDFNRNSVIRKLEYLVAFFTRRSMTLGIMQIKSKTIISNERSIIMACQKIQDTITCALANYPDVSQEYLLTIVTDSYNGKTNRYAETVEHIYEIISDLETPKDEPQEVTNSIEEIRSYTDEIEYKIKLMSMEEKVGQLLLVEFDDLSEIKEEKFQVSEEMLMGIENYKIGGIILREDNIESKTQIQELFMEASSYCSVPLILAIEHEGGFRNILYKKKIEGCEPIIPQSNILSDTDAYYLGIQIGKELSSLGFNMDLSVVADINSSLNNSELCARTFSNQEYIVSNRVAYITQGIQNSNVGVTLIHFPGIGRIEYSEKGNEISSKSKLNFKDIKSLELIPFSRGIAAGCDAIMVSHVSFPEICDSLIPSSMSKTICTVILRETMQFKGLIISESLKSSKLSSEFSTEQIILSMLSAGSDLLLAPSNVEETFNILLRLVKTGQIEEKRIDESLHRILEFKKKRCNPICEAKS